MERSALIKAVISRGRELAEIERIMAQRELRQGPGPGKALRPKPKELPADEELFLFIGPYGVRPKGTPSSLHPGPQSSGPSYKDVATSVTEAYLSTLRAGGTPAEALAAREAAKAQGEHPVAPEATGRDRI